MSLYFLTATYEPLGYYRYYRTLFAKWSENRSYLSVRQIYFKWDGAWKTNAMTANSTGNIGGLSTIVSASSEYSSSYAAWYAFNNSTSNWWSGANDSGYQGKMNWLKVDFGRKIKVTDYKMITGSSHYAVDFILQGSNDDSTWDNLDSRMGQNTSTTQEYAITSVAGSYYYYKWQILRVNNSNYTYIREITLKWNDAFKTNAKTADATGNGTIGGLDAITSASSTNHSGVPAWEAFDGDTTSTGNGWASSGGSFSSNVSTTTYIQAQLGSAVTLQQYKMLGYDSNTQPVGWELLASNDGSTWYLLDFQGDQTTTTEQTYTVRLNKLSPLGYIGIRGIFAGGQNTSTGSSINVIQYFTINSGSNCSDFGDMVTTRRGCGSGASTTRGIIGAGYSSSYINNIDYITIATTGNAADFGDTTVASRYAGPGISNQTRWLQCGGEYVGVTVTKTMDYVTITTTGNASNFGSLSVLWRGSGAISSPTRGVVGGGQQNTTSDPYTNNMEYVTIATTGDATDFGDLTQARAFLCGVSNNTRGCFCGGGTSSTVSVNTIDYVTIDTTGNATDFGDLLANNHKQSGLSNAHGGLAG